ncbi:MAG: hypothetical protein K2Z80_26150 [Xanthobacteraceae bacterium]|nr:hypothetical protein [Xanthobacteraceae bacterium]
MAERRVIFEFMMPLPVRFRAVPVPAESGTALDSLLGRIFCGEPLHTPDQVRGRLSPENALKRDDFSSNRHPALASCLSVIFSENRFTLFGIML